MKRILLSAAMLVALSASAQSTRFTKFISTSAESIDTEAVQSDKAFLTRTLYQGYNTICLPFALTAEEFASTFGEMARLEKPVGAMVENGEFTLYFSDCTNEGMEAGIPYLIKSDAVKYVRISNTTGSSVSMPASVTFGDGNGNVATFKGSFERLQPIGTWAIPAVQGEVPADLVCCDGARTLNPTRCFFTWDAQQGASKMAIRHIATGDVVTGINAATIEGSEATFNIAGQRVKNAHGLIIKSGKKVLE